MTDEEIYPILDEIFDNVLDLSDIKLTSTTSAEDVEGWDSLSHVRLIVAIERRVKVKFSSSEVENLKNIGDLVALIRLKRG